MSAFYHTTNVELNRYINANIRAMEIHFAGTLPFSFESVTVYALVNSSNILHRYWLAQIDIYPRFFCTNHCNFFSSPY